jgi:hypothetical protein
VAKAEAALAAKIKCEDFRKNTNGTWTSGPDTKIGDSAFPQHKHYTDDYCIFFYGGPTGLGVTAYRQKSLNGFGDNSVYLTVCRMSLWPR